MKYHKKSERSNNLKNIASCSVSICQGRSMETDSCTDLKELIFYFYLPSLQLVLCSVEP